MPNDYFNESRQTHLAFWGLGHMLRGALYAATFLVSIGLFVWAIYLIGLLLPEESRQTPSPYGALEPPLSVGAGDLA